MRGSHTHTHTHTLHDPKFGASLSSYAGIQANGIHKVACVLSLLPLPSSCPFALSLLHFLSSCPFFLCLLPLSLPFSSLSLSCPNSSFVPPCPFPQFRVARWTKATAAVDVLFRPIDALLDALTPVLSESYPSLFLSILIRVSLPPPRCPPRCPYPRLIRVSLPDYLYPSLYPSLLIRVPVPLHRRSPRCRHYGLTRVLSESLIRVTLSEFQFRHFDALLDALTRSGPLPVSTSLSELPYPSPFPESHYPSCASLEHHCSRLDAFAAAHSAVPLRVRARL